MSGADYSRTCEGCEHIVAEPWTKDAFAALSQEFERSSRILAEEWAQTSALAKIAVISEEG